MNDFKRKKHIITRKIIIISLCILLVCISAASGVVFIYKLLNEIRTEEYYKELDELRIIGEDVLHPADTKREGASQMITAWISIPCIDCSYPVMYSGDNEYYQHRDPEGNYAFAGSLFIDMFCNADLSSANTIIYGHNMLNGTMFGKIWHIAFRDAAQDDPYFWIYTDKCTCRYRIFSAFETTKYSEGFKQFREGSRELASWCVRMKESSLSVFPGDIPDENSKIVTLATCGATEEYRTIVMGVLEEIEEGYLMHID